MKSKQKKYRMLEEVETFVIAGKEYTLHPIEATKSFETIEGNTIEIGSRGGWIEKEENLSQTGLCWIDNDTFVVGNARVYEGAYLCNTTVYDSAHILGSSHVRNSTIYGDSQISGYLHLNWCELINVEIVPEEMFSEKVINFTEVELKDSTIKTSHDGNFSRIKGEGIRLICSAPSHLYDVEFGKDTKIYFLGESNNLNGGGVHSPLQFSSQHCLMENSLILGNPVIQARSLTLENTVISGEAEVNGTVKLIKVKLEHHAKIINETGILHMVESATIQDMAIVRFRRGLSEQKRHTIHLAQDEIFEYQP